MHKPSCNTPCVLIITGPTASGKTALSELLVQSFPSEVINADVGQFYTPLSIGTAKPDVTSLAYTVHGFDLINEPRDLSVVAYRDLVVDLVELVVQQGKVPIVVGGSLFYIKSLFFPPHELVGNEGCRMVRYASPTRPECDTELREMERIEGSGLAFTTIDRSKQSLWNQLYAIDPVRAAELHPHDEYRIKRALAIWEKTGVKPSAYKPIFQPAFRAMIVFVSPDRMVLHENIKKRLHIMMQQGWIEETEKIIGTAWEPFLQKKGLIGYPELIDWIKQGKQPGSFDRVVNVIQAETIAYAKRQVTFWKSFVKQLDATGACSLDWTTVETVSIVHEALVSDLKNKFLDFCNKN